MAYYAYGCSSLESLAVPDTSGLETVGSNFMAYYAQNCSSLTELVLPAVGWFKDNNVSWNVPSGRLGILKGRVLDSSDLSDWKALTVSGKTLYTNYIRNPELVYCEDVEPAQGEAHITATSKLSVSGRKIAKAEVRFTADSELSAEGRKVAKAEVRFTDDSELSAEGRKVAKAEVRFTADSELSAEGRKVAKVRFSADSELSAEGRKVAKAETPVTAMTTVLTGETEVVEEDREMSLGLYPPMAKSPVTYLAEPINESVTTIIVDDISKLPDPPNIATIGDREDSETIRYGGKTGNSLIFVTRGFEGDAKEWSAGTPIANVPCAQHIRALQEKYEAHVDNTAADDVHGLLSGGFIIEESGSNDYGSWVRWSNGLQVCWGSKAFPGEGWTGSGDKWYLTGQSLTFPVTFDSAPIFLGTTQDAQIALRSAKLASFNTRTSGVISMSFNGWGTAPNDFYLRWLAIGWWK